MNQARLSGVTGRWILIVVISVSGYCYSADEQQFGRLFTTREERQRLQEVREENMRTAGVRNNTGTGVHGLIDRERAGQTRAGFSPGTEQGKENLPVITLKGLIYKKDRARKAWVDANEGTAALDFREPGSGRILDNGVTIPVPFTGESVKLKPGQSYHLHSGAVTDLKDDVP